jgi:hypothetical protein
MTQMNFLGGRILFEIQHYPVGRTKITLSIDAIKVFPDPKKVIEVRGAEKMNSVCGNYFLHCQQESIELGVGFVALLLGQTNSKHFLSLAWMSYKKRSTIKALHEKCGRQSS